MTIWTGPVALTMVASRKGSTKQPNTGAPATTLRVPRQNQCNRAIPSPIFLVWRVAPSPVGEALQPLSASSRSRAIIATPPIRLRYATPGWAGHPAVARDRVGRWGYDRKTCDRKIGDRKIERKANGGAPARGPVIACWCCGRRAERPLGGSWAGGGPRSENQ